MSTSEFSSALVALLPSTDSSTTPQNASNTITKLYSYDDSMIFCSQKLQARWQTLITLQRQQHFQLRRKHHNLQRPHCSFSDPTMTGYWWPCHYGKKRQRSHGELSENEDLTIVYHAPIIDPYQLLQVRRDAHVSEIKRAYRRLALWHHPVRCQADTMTTAERTRRMQIFHMLAAAYETLCDPDIRRRCNVILQQEQQTPTTAEAVMKEKQGMYNTDNNNNNYYYPAGQSHSQNTNPLFWRQINTVPSILDDDHDDDEEEDDDIATDRKGSTFPAREAPGLVDISMTDSSDEEQEENKGREDPVATATEIRNTNSNALLLSTTTATSNLGTVLSSSLTDHSQLEQQPSKQLIDPSNTHTVDMPHISSDRGCDQACRMVLDCARGPSSGDDSMPFSAATLNLHSTSTSTPRVHTKRSGTAIIPNTMEPHYTQQDTDRLFGGPLQLLYRARRWKPFTDPYKVFESVFGTSLGAVTPVPASTPTTTTCNGSEMEKTTPKSKTPSTPSVTNTSNTITQPWHKLERTVSTPKGGHTRAIRQDDGSLLLLTSRIVHHKRITRCERRWVDPTTGQIHAEVSVTSEVLHDDDDDVTKTNKDQALLMHPNSHQVILCDDVIPFFMCSWEGAMCGSMCGN
jgi:curved DNA-binding protein CbpA